MQRFDPTSLKYNRKSPERIYIKVGIGLIVVLALLNAVLAIFLIREAKNSKRASLVLQETNSNLVLLQDALSRMDMQKAFVHLADARRRIAVADPQEPVAPPARKEKESEPAAKKIAEPKAPPAKQPVVAEQKSPAGPVKAVDFKMPAGETPAPLAWAVAGEYALICEKESKLLHLFKFQDERFVLVKSYPCIIGANGSDKKKAGDYATPKGSYFTLRYIPGNTLAEIYGEGAFVLNYPNFLDRKDSKNGAGIWIHGHAPGKVIGVGDLLNTRGCIAVSNGHIRELKGFLKPGGTHVSIVDKITFVKESNQKGSLQEIRDFMDAWRRGWESGDTEKYLSHYSKDFINSEGMNYDAFKRHKERVNRGKKFIRVKTEQMAIVFPQERDGQVAVVRFVQRYRSNNFESDAGKLFYLKKGRGGWTIFGESAF